MPTLLPLWRAARTTGKQCGLTATGDYQPSLRSPWLAAKEQACRYLVKDFGTSKSPKSTRLRDSRYAPTVLRTSRFRIAHCSKAACALLHHDSRNDSTAFRMHSLYALHRSLPVAIPAIQPRLRLSGTNRLGFQPSMAISGGHCH
ncbi:MAG: hypothetical protein RNU03_13440 [Candidatus Sedimenticola sp. (ex Thyasira tokunagai)]